MWIIKDPAGSGPPLVESKTCLLPMITADIWFLFRLFRQYEKGNLLVSGGIMDQPHAYIDAMEHISEAKSDAN